MIDRVLVIKLGALGDFVLAMGPFAAIRKAHPDARITLLTTAPFAGLACDSGYFNEVWTDTRPTLLSPASWLALRRRLRGGRFDRVYDLQTSDRTGWYFFLMGPGRRPEWSGIARGCSHPHANPLRNTMHSIERQNEQLAMAGIADVPAADLSWIRADTSRFTLSGKYVLLVPGGAPHRPRKRWPVERYIELARDLIRRSVEPIVLGGAAEAELGQTICATVSGVRNLVGGTGLAEIAALAHGAAGAVGNDTGPMHMIAAADCPSVVLFSSESDPALTRPRGAAVTVLQREDLGGLPASEVAAGLSLR